MGTIPLYIATVLMWGFSWYAIALQVGAAPPEVSVFHRFVLAGLIQAAWCAATGVSLRLSMRQHAHCALLGVLLFGINFVIIYYASQRLPSGLVSVCFSLITVLNIINGRIFLGRVSAPIVWVATALGIAGIIIVFRNDLSLADDGMQTVIGVGLALFSTLFASLGNIFSLKVQKTGLTVLQSTTWGMLYGAAAIAAIAGVGGKSFAVPLTAAYLGGLFYLVFGASIAAFGCYLTLIRRIGPDRAAYSAVMYPAVALSVSIWLEGLAFTPEMAAGAALVLFGNLLVLMPKTAWQRLKSALLHRPA